MKANYGRVGNRINVRWQAGVFVAEVPPNGLDQQAAGAKAKRVFLKLLALFTEQGRRVNHAGGSTYAPKVFADHPGAEGMTKKAFGAAMNGLLAEGKIRVETEGPPSKRRSFLVRTDQ